MWERKAFQNRIQQATSPSPSSAKRVILHWFKFPPWRRNWVPQQNKMRVHATQTCWFCEWKFSFHGRTARSFIIPNTGCSQTDCAMPSSPIVTNSIAVSYICVIKPRMPIVKWSLISTFPSQNAATSEMLQTKHYCLSLFNHTLSKQKYCPFWNKLCLLKSVTHGKNKQVL